MAKTAQAQEKHENDAVFLNGQPSEDKSCEKCQELSERVARLEGVVREMKITLENILPVFNAGIARGETLQALQELAYRLQRIEEYLTMITS